MKTLFSNISILAGVAGPEETIKKGRRMSDAGILENAWMLVEDERIEDFGPMDSCPEMNPDRAFDCSGSMVLPSFCDSHTHVVYAGSREREFIDKIEGLSYEEIAARGGGILNSADLLHETSEDELYRQSLARVLGMMSKGSGAIEIKSGYGLDTEDELKMLRVIRRIRESVPAVIRSTFLGAHAVGRGLSKDEYVRKVCVEMLPRVAGEGLADFVDVFCDRGFFSPEDMDVILGEADKFGLRAKVHVDEIATVGGMEVAVRHGALSVDHLEQTGEEGIAILKEGGRTIPTMLPGSSFFLNLPYGKARDFVDAGLPLALASDFNPGSSPSGDMRFTMAQGCIRMRLRPEEAFNACTLNGAAAMGAERICGSISRGKTANFMLTEPQTTLGSIPYHYTAPFIRKHFLRGKEFSGC